MYRVFKFMQIRLYLLIFYKPMCVFFICIPIFVYICVQLCAIHASLHRLNGFCVRRCMDLRNICGFSQVVQFLCSKRIMRMNTALHTLYRFFVLSGLCVLIQLCVGCTTFAHEAACSYLYGFVQVVRLLRFQRLVCTDTASQFRQHLNYSVFRIRLFVRRNNETDHEVC